MNRDQLAHILRAASTISGDPDVLVLGSQSVLGTWSEDELPEEAVRSIEADVSFLDDSDARKSDEVDGQMGEDSQFHATHGYYAQGVEIEVATLPHGWRDRLVTLENENTRPGRGLCLDPHDLVLAKLVAGREKDFAFAAALLRVGLVHYDVLEERAVLLPVLPLHRRLVVDWIVAARKSYN